MGSIRFHKCSSNECADEVDYVRGIYWRMKWTDLPKFNYVVVTNNEHPEYWQNRKLRNIKIFDLQQKNDIGDGKTRYDGWKIQLGDYDDTDFLQNYTKSPVSIIDPKYNEEHNSIYHHFDDYAVIKRDIWVEVRYLDFIDI
jgi:hypothetical protein